MVAKGKLTQKQVNGFKQKKSMVKRLNLKQEKLIELDVLLTDREQQCFKEEYLKLLNLELKTKGLKLTVEDQMETLYFGIKVCFTQLVIEKNLEKTLFPFLGLKMDPVSVFLTKLISR